MFVVLLFVFFFFKQKTAYEMRISDWSSDVCSSDLPARAAAGLILRAIVERPAAIGGHGDHPGRQAILARQLAKPRIDSLQVIDFKAEFERDRKGDRKSVV